MRKGEEAMQKENGKQEALTERESVHEHRQPFCELDEEALFDMAELFKAFADSKLTSVNYGSDSDFC